ncbi:hypothetical protein KP509_19G004000 [Ceratopteris richardii]|uniref:DYW domain-containing protein n=1 Tax=Ceratopteris richardii TaxID=49495 RepID=A0A8T2SHP3_CERRI|nr:hypothetical protein KP509_19G004000 [Ceratopteris richardii]
MLKSPRSASTSRNSIQLSRRNLGGPSDLLRDCHCYTVLLQKDHLEKYAHLIRGCANNNGFSEGTSVHGEITEHGLERDRFLGNLLLQMYGNCGSIRDARAVFDGMRDRNVFSWSLIIGAYARNRKGNEALKLFRSMLHDGHMPDRVIFVNIISVCASLKTLAVGKWVNSFISTCGHASDTVLGTSLINMYGKCGCLEQAHITFKGMHTHDAISWTALISSYAQNGSYNEAIHFYYEMKKKAIVPNRVTFACILDACADKAAVIQGKCIHEDVKACELEGDIIVGNALISLYGKCGELKTAQRVFHKMCYRDVVSWTALISAYAQQGKYKDALRVFETMLSRNVMPDKIAFLIVLSTCSHAGLLKQGYDYFNSMKHVYHISPGVEHFNSMLDLLGRLGRLKEGETMISEMPLEPNATTWMTMLGSCAIHADVERGEHAANCVFKLDPENPTPHVLLANIYASAGRWEESKRVRQRMKDMGLRKQQGHSIIEVNGQVYEFTAGHFSHPKTTEIHKELLLLKIQIKDMGYVPDTKAVLHDVDEEEKENMLLYHSEKLAVAYGIINTAPGSPLCIIKNLRICNDCHSAMKFVSKLVNRKITVRDIVRFHVFKDGVCSCADYW